MPITGVVLPRRTTLSLAAGSLLAGSVAAAAAVSRAQDWRPLSLLALLLVLAVTSDLVIVEIRNLRLSGAFLAIVLAMALLGPAPAVAIGASSAFIEAVVSRLRPHDALANIATYACFPLLGGLAIDAVPVGGDEFWFAAVVFAVFLGANCVNFALIAAAVRFAHQVPASVMLRAFATALPTEFATALLTAGVVFTYGRLGVGAIALAAVVLLVFQYILRASVQAQVRGEELERRTKELASLQVGLLSTVLQTLSMRDAMTARHSAAVARYSREVASMLGLDEREQDLIHTAALLHDIGKFILPDSILFADRKLTDEEWQLIKLHPEQGAQPGRAHRGLRPGRRDRHASPRALLRRRLSRRHRRRADPARLTHHRRRRHLRRHDLARLLPAPGQLRGRARRAAPRGRHRSSTRRWWRCSSA